VLRISPSILLLGLLAGLLAGCASTKNVQQEDDDFYSKFPPLALSSELIHSPGGDLTARIPKDWITIDPEKLESPQIFAAACNPDYTVSLIFSELQLDNTVRSIFDREGLKGVAELDIQRRQRRSNGRLQQIGETEEFAIGRRKFGAFTYSTDSSKTLTRVAVFSTGTKLYSCAITHLTFNDHEIPSAQTMREMHQIVLGGMEW
jgi:hypothetical protein